MSYMKVAKISSLVVGCCLVLSGIFGIFNTRGASLMALSLLVAPVTELLQGLLLFRSKPVQVPVQNAFALASPLLLTITLSIATGISSRLPVHLGPVAEVGACMTSAGLMISLFATLALGRSFGVFAELREVRTQGLYRWCRHPLYVTYFLQYIGVALTSASLLVMLLMLIACGIQVLRAFQEEVVLRTDPSYVKYAEATGMFFPRLKKPNEMKGAARNA